MRGLQVQVLRAAPLNKSATGGAVKDQINADLVMAGGKAAPAVVGSAYSAAQGLALADIAVILTIIYTAALLFTTVVKNWGLWMSWWAERAGDIRRLLAWMRGDD